MSATSLIILSIFVLSATYVHWRGQVRHNLLRQITSYTSILAPLNVLIYAFSKVPMKPYQDADRFPEVKLLRDNWQAIAAEANALYEGGDIRPYTALNDVGFYSFAKRGWTRFYLNWYGHIPASAERLCPKTLELLRQVPSVRAAMFAVLPPGGKLTQHRDPYAGSVRYHLGLSTPNDDRCHILVDGIPYSWRDGEGVLFDETYIHWAFNKTERHRIILFCDIERPLWTPFMRVFNRFMGGLLGSATVARNFPDEKLGVFNRIIPHLYGLRGLGKSFKQFNAPLYYLWKYTVFALLIFIIFFH
jgi:beta-hydroxylase